MAGQGRGGSIVNIGSMWAHQAIAATPSSGYSVAKGGLHALTRNLAMELAPHHIRVNPAGRCGRLLRLPRGEPSEIEQRLLRRGRLCRRHRRGRCLKQGDLP